MQAARDNYNFVSQFDTYKLNMHIVIVALHRPSKPTGICRHAANLAQCLADTNEVAQVTLIIGAWQQDYFETLFNSNKIKLIGVNIKNSSLIRNLWFLFGLPVLVNRLHADIVYMSFPFPFLRPLFSSPIVSTIHDLYPYENPEVFGYPNVIFNRLFLQQCIANSDGLACVSKSTLSSLNKYFPNTYLSKPVTVIYNYVNFNLISCEQPNKTNIKENEPFLLCVAQHRKNKNIDLLIETFSLLNKQQYLSDSTKLVVVGSTGPETDSLHVQISALSLQERVLLVNSIQDNELCLLYQNCQIFVAPSSQEGFCLPLAEAMYFSCRIVCSDISIFKEIGSNSCSYFDLKGDAVSNLSQAIVRTLKLPLNQTNDDFRFSKSTVASQYLKFFSSIINNNTLPPNFIQPE